MTSATDFELYIKVDAARGKPTWVVLMDYDVVWCTKHGWTVMGEDYSCERCFREMEAYCDTPEGQAEMNEMWTLAADGRVSRSDDA